MILKTPATATFPWRYLTLSPSSILTRIMSAKSGWPLGKIEIVHNGKVVAEAKGGRTDTALKVNVKLPIDHSGWIAARCTGHPDHPGMEAVLAAAERDARALAGLDGALVENYGDAPFAVTAGPAAVAALALAVDRVRAAFAGPVGEIGRAHV